MVLGCCLGIDLDIAQAFGRQPACHPSQASRRLASACNPMQGALGRARFHSAQLHDVAGMLRTSLPVEAAATEDSTELATPPETGRAASVPLKTTYVAMTVWL